MDRSKLAWFGMGLLVGLGVLFGATMQDGKRSGRFQVVESRWSNGPTLVMHSTLLVDTETGKVCEWGTGKQDDGWLFTYWRPIRTLEEESRAYEAWKADKK